MGPLSRLQLQDLIYKNWIRPLLLKYTKYELCYSELLILCDMVFEPKGVKKDGTLEFDKKDR